MTVVRAALAACLLLLAWWAGIGGAGAADLEAYSWWWRGNSGPAPLPVPTTVPEGGIVIGGAPDGATAIAAVRYQLVGGESSPTLVLRVAEERGGDVAVIAACPSGSAWGPNERGGPWDAKPNAACELGSVNGQRDATAGTWTFPLAPIVQSDVVDVVIVAGTISPEAPVGSTFQIAFHPPDAGALTTSASSSGDTSASATDADFPAPVAPGEFNPELPSGGLDVTPTADLPVATPFTPALPPSSQGITATAPAVQVAQPPRLAVPASSSRDGAGLAFLVLLAAVGAMYWANRVPVPAPRRLGPLSAGSAHAVAVPAAPEAGGLGRFARPRHGPPPPLV